MQISVSSTLTLYHDGQFWVGIIEHIEDGQLGVARIVFGAEPSDEEILQFVTHQWERLSFFESQKQEAPTPARNPKRRQREAAKALTKPAMSTKAQQALTAQREAGRRASTEQRRERRDEGRRVRFEQRTEKRKQKRRGH